MHRHHRTRTVHCGRRVLSRAPLPCGAARHSPSVSGTSDTGVNDNRRGTDSLVGSHGADVLPCWVGDDLIEPGETVPRGMGWDRLQGTAGRDTLISAVGHGLLETADTE